MDSTVCGASFLNAGSAICPVCNTPGKKVRPETVKSIVKGGRVQEMPEGYTTLSTTSLSLAVAII